MAKKKTVDERVAEVFAAHPEPVEEVAPVPHVEAAKEPEPAETLPNPHETVAVDPVIEAGRAWLVEAETAQAVYSAGNVISPDDLKSLLNRAIGLMHPFVD